MTRLCSRGAVSRFPETLPCIPLPKGQPTSCLPTLEELACAEVPAIAIERVGEESETVAIGGSTKCPKTRLCKQLCTQRSTAGITGEIIRRFCRSTRPAFDRQVLDVRVLIGTVSLLFVSHDHSIEIMSRPRIVHSRLIVTDLSLM